MDTREKILPKAALRSVLDGGSWALVVALFDPLTLEQAEKISSLTDGGRQVCALVIDREGTLMEAQARAALMAGLRSVAAVSVAKEEEWQSLLPSGTSVEVFDEIAADEQRSREFAQFILRRQASAESAPVETVS